MEQPTDWHEATVTFETSDGVRITGDLATPDSGDGEIAAIVCHPHPQYGGNRYNNVVAACWRSLADASIAALRFDFRSDFGDGVSERLDAVAAVDELAERFPSAKLVAVGYSFGAVVTLGLTDPRVAAMVLIAPPLTAMPVDVTPVSPTFVLTPVGDQFTPPDAALPIVDGWRATNPDVTFGSVTMADHFLAGRADDVARRAADWIREHAA